MRTFGPLKQEHIFDIMRWRNAQMDVLRQKRKLTRAGQERWFAGLKADKNQVLFAIYEWCEGRQDFVGYCGLTNIDREHRRAEISFLVDPQRVNKSNIYSDDMTSALAFLAEYAFKKLKCKKIFTETYAFRKAHIGILEKFGLRKEGVLRSHIVLKGKFHDSIVHSMLDQEYILTRR